MSLTSTISTTDQPSQEVQSPSAPATNFTLPVTHWPSPSAEFLALISHEFSRKHLVLSTGCRGDVEHLVTSEYTKPLVVFNIGVKLGRPVHITHTTPEFIASAIDHAYSQAVNVPGASDALGSPSLTLEGSGDLDNDIDIAIRESERDLLNTLGKAPAVRLVDLVIFEALLRGASDVHIQPVRNQTLIRYRLDGALHTVRALPGSLASSVVSRIKVMASLDVAEHRAPQDGRATVTIGGNSGNQSGRRVDLRISTLPSSYGERVVLRLLDPARSPQMFKFSQLGMPQHLETSYLTQVSRTSGIVLSTGPTGSGKTTTLYTTLAWLSTSNTESLARGCELNMLTIEDPVEYDLSAGGKSGLSISQTQVDPKRGLTFVTGLKHILRQDPDVIMVGEIRDEETARIAVQASLTGHLVLSTLHTNDACSAVARLLDLGVEPFLVSSSLSAVLAQRLVRTTHASCSGNGCAACLATGYKGRIGVFELLVLNDHMRDMVCQRASAVELKAAAQRAKMVTLREAADKLVQGGYTTRQEVSRVIGSEDEVHV